MASGSLRLLLILCALAVSACSHMKSGQHVYWRPGVPLEKIAKENHLSLHDLREVNPNAHQGQWLFVPNKVGFLPFLNDTVIVGDYSQLGHGEYAWPVPSHRTVSSHFGERWGRKHEGLDIPAPKGTPVVATAEGQVRYNSNKVRGYGNMIVIEHPGKIFSVYAHLSKSHVKQGQKVKKGQMIARVGNTGRSTGPHLHFEIRVRNRARDPAQYVGTKAHSSR